MRLPGNNYIIHAREWILDLLFPISCIGCGGGEKWLCDDCKMTLRAESNYYCPGCHVVVLVSGLCSGCRGHLDGLWSLTDYNSSLVSTIIKTIKYNYVSDLSGAWDGLMADYFKLKEWAGTHVLVPIPLHHKRYLRRGFNQAELICERIGAMYGNETKNDILIRTVNNKPQAKLGYSGRKENVKGIFAVNLSKDLTLIQKKIVVLVDDVYTTGSTMQECARILKEAGFTRVLGLVIARG